MASYAKFDVWQNTAGVNYNAVLQVQSSTLTSTFSTTTLITAGGAATGLSVSITPKYATSKILVFGSMVVGLNTSTQAYFKLFRDVTEIGSGVAVGSRPGIIARTALASTTHSGTLPFSYLDSPSSVSSLTYQIYLGAEAAFSVYLNRTDTDTNAINGARGASTITVVEIAQ